LHLRDPSGWQLSAWLKKSGLVHATRRTHCALLSKLRLQLR
jgi:hypothetical protein